MIENIYPEDWQQTRGFYSPAKKIDMGSFYMIYVFICIKIGDFALDIVGW